VAEADYDCRPPDVRPTASEPKTNRFFAARAILHSSPDPSSLAPAALPDDAVLAFNVRAFCPDGDRVPHERKKCSKPSLGVDLHQPLGNLRGSNWIIWLAPEPFRRPSWVMNAFAHSARLGSTRSAM